MAKVDKDGNEVGLNPKQEKARQKSYEQLAKKALLVSMHKKTFANFPFDPVFTDQVVKKYLKTDNSNLVVIRKFLIDPKHMKNIRSLANDALLMVYNYTRPWDNVGYRLLPMELWDDFNETFSKIKDEFEEAVQVFVDNWDDYKAEAKKALGPIYRETDYPDKSALRGLFELKIETSNFPDIDDIRLNLTGEDILAMEKEAVEKYSSAIADAREELLKQLEDLEKELRNASGDPDKAARWIKIIEKLNIDEDPQVNIKLESTKDLLKNTKTNKKDLKKQSEISEEDMLLTSDEDFDELDDFMVE